MNDGDAMKLGDTVTADYYGTKVTGRITGWGAGFVFLDLTCAHVHQGREYVDVALDSRQQRSMQKVTSGPALSLADVREEQGFVSLAK